MTVTSALPALGVHDIGENRVQALLEKWGLPERYRGVGNCILGYPACDHPAPAPRKDGRIVKIG